MTEIEQEIDDLRIQIAVLRGLLTKKQIVTKEEVSEYEGKLRDKLESQTRREANNV